MGKEPAKKEAGAKTEAPAAAAEGKGGGGKSGMKVVMMVVAVLVLEVGTVAVTMMMSGAPKAVEAHATEPDTKVEEDRLVEILVAKDQFPNQRTGRVYLYDTEIFIVIHQKDSEKIKKNVESMQATLATDIGVIFRKAEPAQLLEPSLATLTRQIKAALDERIGHDAEGKPIVQEALVKKCIQFRAEG